MNRSNRKKQGFGWQTAGANVREDNPETAAKTTPNHGEDRVKHVLVFKSPNMKNNSSNEEVLTYFS